MFFLFKLFNTEPWNIQACVCTDKLAKSKFLIISLRTLQVAAWLAKYIKLFCFLHQQVNSKETLAEDLVS